MRRGTLKISVHDASGFVAGDWMTSTSDAFVVAELVDYERSPGAPQWPGNIMPARARRTSVQKRSTKPVWNEVLELDADDHELECTTLRVSLWDEDTGKLRELGSRSNDLLGYLVVDVRSLLDSGTHAPTPTMHQPLFDRSGRRGENGSLSFTLQFFDRDGGVHGADQLVHVLREELASLQLSVRGLEVGSVHALDRLEALRYEGRARSANAAGGVAQSMLQAARTLALSLKPKPKLSLSRKPKPHARSQPQTRMFACMLSSTTTLCVCVPRAPQ